MHAVALAGRRTPLNAVPLGSGAIAEYRVIDRIERNKRTVATQRLFASVGQQFFTDRYRPILAFVADHSRGVHDSPFASCDIGLQEILGGGSSNPNCPDNFLRRDHWVSSPTRSLVL